ncbi:MAG TPA: hypothetical protein VFW85_06555 [Gaiellaceae bacterium]|nr:hypothetical protein [Gaiellaceae bacterium]
MRELPAALPPAERTVGQLIAETIRAYGANFWRALPLGVPIAVSTQLSLGYDANVQTLILFAFAPLIAAAFVGACYLIHGVRPTVMSYLVAVLVFAPVPFLVRLIVLPAVGWLALFGLAVPAAMVESLGFGTALARGRKLAVADFVHAFGSLCALVIVVAIGELTLIALLRSQGDTGQRVAHGLADVVLTPMLYLGGALLYVDQAARVGSRRPTSRRRRDADLHPPVDADATGRSDPQVEP